MPFGVLVYEAAKPAERYIRPCNAPDRGAQLTAVDPATNVAHPNVLTPASAPALALVGVGVRTVSFLRMKVYSAGFYVDDYTLKRLGSLPGWKGYTPAELQGPDAQALVQSVLDAPAACAVNISESMPNTLIPCYPQTSTD